jgi:hypothetical protein
MVTESDYGDAAATARRRRDRCRSSGAALRVRRSLYRPLMSEDCCARWTFPRMEGALFRASPAAQNAWARAATTASMALP